MKKITLIGVITLFITSFLSCSNDDGDSKNTSYYGKWELSRMAGNGFILAVYSIGQPQWKETYDFKKDNTFIKTKVQNETTITASGTFSVATIQNRPHLQLTYTNPSEIVGSCKGNQSEELVVNEAGTLNSTWQNCDGPSLEYKKVK